MSPGTENSNLELLSREVRDILGKQPSAVLKWGTLVLCGAVTLMVATGFFYQYPETINGELTLTPAVPPVPVRAPQTGYISELKVSENEVVAKGDVIAVFASNAELSDVLTLEKEVDMLSELDYGTMQSYRPNPQLRLGELAPFYANVESIFDYFSETQGDAPSGQQLAIFEIQRHIQQLNNANRTLANQKNRAEIEYEGLKKEYRLATSSYEKSINDADARIQMEAYLKMTKKVSEISNIEAQMEANKAMIIDDNSRILELRSQQKSGASDKIAQLKQNLGILKSEIQQWKDRYLIVAPADGKVSFYSELTPKQLLTVGEDVLAIVPPNAQNEFVGSVKIPVEGSGKVKQDQMVNLMFDRYNHHELGMVKGKVVKIFPLMKGNKYSVEVKLLNGLVTTKGQELDYYLQMGGTAEIITADKSFISRVFSKLTGA